MPDLELNFNIEELTKDMDDVFLRQIPYICFRTLNSSLFKTRQDISTKIFTNYIEGGPVAFTKRGVQYNRAPNKHMLIGRIFIPEGQWKYMRWVVDAGDKRWLRSKGGIGIPIDMPMNKHGNVVGRRRKETIWRPMLEQLHGSHSVPRGKLPRKQFIGESKNGTVGLWERQSGRQPPKLKMLFTKKAVHYKKSVPFFEKGSEYFVKRFRLEFRKEFNKQMSNVLSRRK